MELAPRADDVWVSSVAVRAGIRCWQVKPVQAEFPRVPGSQVGTLWGENVKRGGNGPPGRRRASAAAEDPRMSDDAAAVAQPVNQRTREPGGLCTNGPHHSPATR